MSTNDGHLIQCRILFIFIDWSIWSTNMGKICWAKRNQGNKCISFCIFWNSSISWLLTTFYFISFPILLIKVLLNKEINSRLLNKEVNSYAGIIICLYLWWFIYLLFLLFSIFLFFQNLISLLFFISCLPLSLVTLHF